MAQVPMGPPPPPTGKEGSISGAAATTASATPSAAGKTSTSTAPPNTPMGPPPPRNPTPITISTESDSSVETERVNAPSAEETQPKGVVENNSDKDGEKDSNSLDVTPRSKDLAAPYSIPPWSEHPGHPFYVEVLKDGAIVERLDVSVKGAYMFGRVDSCDFVLEHPTISRFHAVLQFRKSGEVFIYDLGSTHGTFVNKSQVKKKVYTELHVGDVIRFGQSSRLYIFQGPVELMLPEGDLSKIRKFKIQEELKDREASLLRARVEASLADGISWGMAEDAHEEAEIDADEVTWQTYKGQLTEKQEKTRSKVIKRIEKVANMRKEIDVIRAKDIAQGGLTQGQQTQIARNEQRISQIMEELDSLEETLNESIQESIGARVKMFAYSKKKGTTEDDDEVVSEDDDFYDRTKKKSSQKTSCDHQSVETVDTLLDKKGTILREIEEKNILLQKEDGKTESQLAKSQDNDDALDAYMTGLSSELALDATVKIKKEISALQSDLDRVLYLLKIADPTGEAAQKRVEKPHISKHNESNSLTKIHVQSSPKRKKSSTFEEPAEESGSLKSIQTKKLPEEEKVQKPVFPSAETKSMYAITKPQWLGAVKDTQQVEVHANEVIVDAHENDHDEFVDYKDRKKSLIPASNDREIEDAAPGLILRKRKHIDEARMTSDTVEESASTSNVVETTATDAVALLLKHKRGYFAGDDELENDVRQNQEGDQSQNKKSKRVLGPEKPVFLGNNRDYESWVPPKGQTGDGRTSLNEKYGY